MSTTVPICPFCGTSTLPGVRHICSLTEDLHGPPLTTGPMHHCACCASKDTELARLRQENAALAAALRSISPDANWKTIFPERILAAHDAEKQREIERLVGELDAEKAQRMRIALACCCIEAQPLRDDAISEHDSALTQPLVTALNLALAAIVNPQAFDLEQVRGNIRAALAPYREPSHVPRQGA